MKFWTLALVLLLPCLPVHAVVNTTIEGAGSSAAAPIYRTWADEYQKSSGISLKYESLGSSAGLKKIRASETGFGASDVAPSEAELLRDKLVVFPVAITGIVPVFNLPRVADDKLRLTGDVLARIYLGEITRWNAPEIEQTNPGLDLPNLAITVVVRGDGSGTTYNFADYLSKVNPTWKTKFGAKTSFTWPAGFTAVKGSEGVVKAVKDTVGAIAYVDYGYVKDNQLHAVQIRNSAGGFVSPSVTAFHTALMNSEWGNKGEFTTTLTNMPGGGAWPITMGTFVVVPLIANQPERTQAALNFFVWALMNGDALVQKNNFVRLPNAVQAKAFKVIASVKDGQGRHMDLKLQ